VKSDPNKILVSAVTGPAEPYGTELVSRTTQRGVTEDQVQTKHSCQQSTGEYADPAIRIKQWTEAFGPNGLYLSICSPSFAPALQLIANKIAGVFGPSCVSGPFPATAPDAGEQPACRVVDRITDAAGTRVYAPLPNCADDGNVAPCWSLIDDAAGCLDGKKLVLNRGTTTPPADLVTGFTCRPCALGPTEPGCHSGP